MWAISTSASEESKIGIFAHYCNWHIKNQNISSWRYANTIPLRYSPPGILGYDSQDKRIIAEHNAEMKANGIIPLISWWGPNTRPGDKFLRTYLSVDSDVQIGILYEVTVRLIKNNTGRFSFDDPRNVRRFIEDITHLHETFFTRFPQRFYKMDGRPVVFIWLSHAFKGRFDLAVQKLREKIPVYIIGSDINIYSHFRPDLISTVRGVDAISAYGIYAPNSTRQSGGHLNRDYVDKYAKSLRDWSTWAENNVPNVKLIVPIEFMFRDNRSNPELRSTPMEASYLLSKIQEFFVKSKCGNVLPYVLVVSYNEHYEGTSIEPTVEYGSFYLDLLRTIFRGENTELYNCK